MMMKLSMSMKIPTLMMKLMLMMKMMFVDDDADDDDDVCCASGRHRIKPLTSARLLSLWATTPPDFARILSS